MSKLRTAVVISVLALGLAACGETRNERALGGALIGTGVGAAAGGLITGNAGGALVGGAIGAGTGAVIGHATAPRYTGRYAEKCYGVNRYGERFYTPCQYN